MQVEMYCAGDLRFCVRARTLFFMLVLYAFL